MAPTSWLLTKVLDGFDIALYFRPGLLKLSKVAVACAGTPFWKLVLKQFDDLLVKASPRLVAVQGAKVHAGLSRDPAGICVSDDSAEGAASLQILIAAAVVDLFIALINGESGLRCGPSQCLYQNGQPCGVRAHARANKVFFSNLASRPC